MFWKYPKLLHLIEFRTIENVTPVHVELKGETIYDAEIIQDNMLLIGYIIGSTTGILSDNTLCIFRFLETWLEIPRFKELINMHKNRICIIDQSIDSWGEKKKILGTNILLEWIAEFLEKQTCDNPIIVENQTKLRINVNITIE